MARIGISSRFISNQFGVHQSVILYLLQTYGTAGYVRKVISPGENGRPQCARTEPYLALPERIRSISESVQECCGPDPIAFLFRRLRRWRAELMALDCNHGVLANVLSLPQDINARLDRACERPNMNIHYWRRVYFSDECTYMLRHYWRKSAHMASWW